MFQANKNFLHHLTKPKHPLVEGLIIFAILLFISIVGGLIFGGRTIGASDSKMIQLNIDGQSSTIPTRAHTVGDLLDNLDINLTKQDAIEPDPRTPITEDGLNININHAKDYAILDKDSQPKYVKVAGVDLADAATKAGYEVFIEDKLRAEPVTARDVLSSGFVGTKLVIDRATPVNVNLYGENVVMRTHQKTVGGLLKESGINLRQGDQVKPSTNTKLRDIRNNLPVFVFARDKKIITKELVINPTVEEIEDPKRPAGEQEVIEEGAPGKRIVAFELDLEKSEKSQRKQIMNIVITPAKKRVVIIGTKFEGFEGSLAAAMAALRQCEAGGNYANRSNPNYRGAYQFGWGTWNNYAEFEDPADAPPAIQDQKALETYRARGWQPWPACSQGLGLQDIYR